MTKPLRGLGSVAAVIAVAGLAGTVAERAAAHDLVLSGIDTGVGATEPAVRLGEVADPPPAPDAEPDPDPAPVPDPDYDGELPFPILEAEFCGNLRDYGEPRSHGAHQGLDILATEGTPVIAVADAELTQIYLNTGSAGYGWKMVDAEGTVYKYFHLTEDFNGLEVGDSVAVGDVIGFVGDSGNNPGNFHLHFEYRPNNVPVNPMTVLDTPSWCHEW